MANNFGNRGEIWIAEIKGKKRPVVVLSDDNLIAEVDHIVGTITSQNARNIYDVEIKYWKEARLDKPSIVRCSKLNTLHFKELLFKIGRLHEEDLKLVLDTIRTKHFIV